MNITASRCVLDKKELFMYRKKTRTPIIKVLVIILVIILCIDLAMIGIYKFVLSDKGSSNPTGDQPNTVMLSSVNSDQNISGSEQPTVLSNKQQNSQEELSLTDTMNTIKTIKNNLGSALNDIKKSKFDSANTKLESVSQNIHSIRSTVEQKFKNVPFLKKQVNTILDLLDTAEIGMDSVLLPAINFMQSHPLSELRVGDGIHIKLLCEYLDFAESVMPEIEKIMACANSVDLSLIDTDGKIADYLNTANELMDIYHADPEVFTKVKSMLGENEDRLYLLAAQNSAETRASGGFPGSIGTIRIQDGVLTLGDFYPVNDMFVDYTPGDIHITNEEYALFNQLSGIQVPRDSDLCPDFVRVGHIWASSYEAKHNKPVNGVISMTPHIVQRILAATNEEIELADGLKLNGNNAMQILQRDIYFKYFGKTGGWHNDNIANELFAEAAQKTTKKLMDNMTLAHLLSYLKIATESFEDRTMMLWMKEEAEQELIVRMDWDGGLNNDPENPETGIFFNCVSAGKMGWFLSIDTSVGERTKNKDGSYSYPVTATFSNHMSSEEIQAAGYYITGGTVSLIPGAAYFFAPAGGSISDFTTTGDTKISLKTYNGLQLGYLPSIVLKPNDPITVTYTVTTATNVETPLAVIQTPTAQQNLPVNAGG